MYIDYFSRETESKHSKPQYARGGFKMILMQLKHQGLSLAQVLFTFIHLVS